MLASGIVNFKIFFIVETGNIIVATDDVTENVTMIPLQDTYSVTFNVTDGTNSIEGARVSFNDVDYNTAADGSLIITEIEDGNYSYSVTAVNYGQANGSITVEGADITEIVTLQLVSINSKAENLFKIYPNPASDFVNIDFSKEVDAIIIYNQIGKVVYNNKNLADQSKIEINISQFQQGIYLIQVERNNSKFPQQIVVE